MVVAEAMSRGVLPISSGVGGAFEVVTHGIDGFLFDPDNSEDLYRKLRWCAKNKEVMFKMSQRGKKHAQKRFSIRRSGSQLDRIYKAMVSKSNEIIF